MHRHALAARDVADDLLAANRVAAARAEHHQVVEAANLDLLFAGAKRAPDGSGDRPFRRLFAQTVGDSNNPTDVFIAPALGALTAQAHAVKLEVHARPAPPLAWTPELAMRIFENVVRTIEARVPGWTAPPWPHAAPPNTSSISRSPP